MALAWVPWPLVDQKAQGTVTDGPSKTANNWERNLYSLGSHVILWGTQTFSLKQLPSFLN